MNQFIKAGHTEFLASIPFTVFGTLTFRLDVTECEALNSASIWIEDVRQKLRLPTERFLWVFRCERGDLFGRVHLHTLVLVRRSQMSFFVVPRGLCAAHRCWKRGMTRFRICQNGDSVIDYILKGTQPGHDYEFKKTAQCETLLVAEAAWSYARRRMSESNRRLHTTADPGTTLFENLMCVRARC